MTRTEMNLILEKCKEYINSLFSGYNDNTQDLVAFENNNMWEYKGGSPLLHSTFRTFLRVLQTKLSNIGTNVNFTNSERSIAVGGISEGTTFDEVSYPDMMNMLLYPELFPTLTFPTLTFVKSGVYLYEIGEAISLSFTATFDRGSIIPAYNTNGFRSGLPNRYNYTGEGLTSKNKTELTDVTEVYDYEVLIGIQQWTVSVNYDSGEQPLSNKGNNYYTPLAADTTSLQTISIEGTYPWFATTDNLSTLKKQNLSSLTTNYIECQLVAEDGINKQKIEVPQAMKTITGFQFFNTISNSWEWINGSKTNSLSSFIKTTTQKSVQGTNIDYFLYTNNDAQTGIRRIRIYTT